MVYFINQLGVNSGFSLLNGKFSKNKGINKKIEREVLQREHIALTPLAMPMLAGPGSISMLIAYYQANHKLTDIIYSCLSILAISILIFIILKSAYYISKILGSSGIVAISRIIGFLTVAIGVQYIITAVQSLLN